MHDAVEQANNPTTPIKGSNETPVLLAVVYMHGQP
jgi:hypothetical protein